MEKQVYSHTTSRNQRDTTPKRSQGAPSQPASKKKLAENRGHCLRMQQGVKPRELVQEEELVSPWEQGLIDRAGQSLWVLGLLRKAPSYLPTTVNLGM